ncbi:MAG: hypothetical protein PHG83_01805 [Patescibacteria group bacterium]|nr:hypothetical protein [Patescibacteria group bacterium]
MKVQNNNGNDLWISIKRSAGYAEGGTKWLVVWEGNVEDGKSVTVNACFDHGDWLQHRLRIGNIDVTDTDGWKIP